MFFTKDASYEFFRGVVVVIYIRIFKNELSLQYANNKSYFLETPKLIMYICNIKHLLIYYQQGPSNYFTARLP